VRDDLLMVRIDGPIYFANVEFIKDKLDLWVSEKGKQIKMLVFNMESVSNIDSTGAHELNEWINTWRKSGLDISMTSIKGPVRDALNRWALLESVGSDHIFLDDDTALSAYDHSINEETLEKYSSYATQTNPK